ncbi:MAG TPA: hypothetical protein VFL85_05355 [Candidatus Saccharimonadales bacterium]|nr:hypothetical protein [Candidatus Saccharimonadales bacterium]
MATKTASTKPVTKAGTTEKSSPKAVAVVREVAGAKARRLRPAPRRFFRFRRRVARPKRIANAWQISRTVGVLVWQHKKIFLGLALIYGVLNLVLVRGFSGGTDVTALNNQLGQVFGGNFGPLLSSTTVFLSLISTSGNTTSATGGAYQSFLILIMSLATIWALRMVMAGDKIRLRDTFYNGMYPLVPFMLVLLVIVLQSLPLLIGAGIYGLLINQGIAVDAGEQTLTVLVSVALAAVTIYWLCASLFALYIVTLPDMTPMKALRSARELVRYRRWPIIRKLLFLPIAGLIIASAVMLPAILFVPVIAQWLFFVLTMFALIIGNTYMYVLYREMLV